MNVLIIRPNTSDFGKVGSYNVQEVGLAISLQKKGYNATVLFAHKAVKKVEVDKTYGFVYYLPHISFGLHGIFRTKILGSFNPDIVIMFSDNQLWAKNIIKWCKKHHVRCVNYFGAVLSDNPRFINQFYTKLILIRNRKSYRYTTNYAKTKKVEKELNKHNIRCDGVIPVGLDTSILSDKKAIDYNVRKSLGFDNKKKIVLFVGRLVDYKRPLLVIDIAKKIIEDDPDYMFLVIGEGPLKEKIIKSIVDYKLSDKIILLGRVPYNNMYKYFISSDCLINLSKKEIFGMTILEAMYYGVPVVAQYAPGPADIIENEKNGFLIDSDDANYWSKTICKACNNHHLKEASIERINSYFTWDILCTSFLYNKI